MMDNMNVSVRVCDGIRLLETFTETFRPGQTVKAKRELEWMYGNSLTIPRGGVIVLANCCLTNAGPRWSGYWKSIYVSNLPEDDLEVYHARVPRRASVSVSNGVSER